MALEGIQFIQSNSNKKDFHKKLVGMLNMISIWSNLNNEGEKLNKEEWQSKI